MEDVIFETIKRHFPDSGADSIHCACGSAFFNSDQWSRHLTEEIVLIEQKAQSATG